MNSDQLGAILMFFVCTAMLILGSALGLKEGQDDIQEHLNRTDALISCPHGVKRTITDTLPNGKTVTYSRKVGCNK